MKTLANIVLDVSNLTKKYGDRVAVDNVSFQVFEGEIFGLIGPNGAGKTTIIRMITGLAKPTTGSVFICGKNIAKDFEKAISNVGGIIENPELYSYMSGMDNLKFYASLYPNVTKEKIREVVSLVGMEKRIYDKVRTYSLGMKQRVGIAQALLNNPKLLILDEPTNGLDPNGIKEMRSFLKNLSAQKKISILVSNWFKLTLLRAISALSFCISNAAKYSPSVFASSNIGIIPVPVPKSNTFSLSFTFAKPESNTASIPKQNLSLFCIIL